MLLAVSSTVIAERILPLVRQSGKSLQYSHRSFKCYVGYHAPGPENTDRLQNFPKIKVFVCPAKCKFGLHKACLYF